MDQGADAHDFGIDKCMLSTDAAGTAPLGKRAGTETALARVVLGFGGAKPHHTYRFANRRATRMKVLVQDGISVWLAACST